MTGIYNYFGVIGELGELMVRNRERHPHYRGIEDPVRAVALIFEEAGEAMKNALDMTRNRGDNEYSQAGFSPLDVSVLRAEALDTASMAIQLVMSIDQMRKESDGKNPAGR